MGVSAGAFGFAAEHAGDFGDPGLAFHLLEAAVGAVLLHDFADDVMATGEGGHLGQMGDHNHLHMLGEHGQSPTDFDSRLASLGARPLVPIVECDVEWDEPFARWISQLEQSLGSLAAA